MADIDLDGGGVDMQTEPTSTAMDKLTRDGADFRAGWDAAMTRVNASRGLLGNGPIGQAFVTSYDPTAKAVMDNMSGEAAPDKVTKGYSDAGKKSVADYIAADADGRNAMPG